MERRRIALDYATAFLPLFSLVLLAMSVGGRGVDVVYLSLGILISGGIAGVGCVAVWAAMPAETKSRRIACVIASTLLFGLSVVLRT